MRVVVLIVGGVAAGALSGGALQTFAPPNSQMLTAVRALGGEIGDIKIADINPLKAYEEVRRRIASGDIGRSLNLRSAPVPSASGLSLGNLNSAGFHIDNAQTQRAWIAGVNDQIRNDNRRVEDISAYARNPSGWHGTPPH
jgi:hypothetical protein